MLLSTVIVNGTYYRCSINIKLLYDGLKDIKNSLFKLIGYFLVPRDSTSQTASFKL